MLNFLKNIKQVTIPAPIQTNGDQVKKSDLLKYVYEISDELNAIKVMKWKGCS